MSGRVFSGIQPTGGLHLGNYLGALKHFAPLQKNYACLYSVVDLHAITVWQEPSALPAMTREVAAAYVACGIDTKKHGVFAQSRVAGHSELAWLLACVARIGWLNRMTQFKEKSGKHSERASIGLYVYPVLMAADILLYRATHVPVGEDQTQHLELARDIAQKFNQDYGKEFFPLPEPLIVGAGARVMSLRDGTKKMSKSDASAMALIFLTDTADDIAQKIRKAKTDPAPLPSEEAGLAGRAEAQNLVGIYAALAEMSVADVLRDYGGAEFSRFKPALTELVVSQICPIGEKMQSLLSDPASLDAILDKGAETANSLAQPTLQELRGLIGLL